MTSTGAPASVGTFAAPALSANAAQLGGTIAADAFSAAEVNTLATGYTTTSIAQVNTTQVAVTRAYQTEAVRLEAKLGAEHPKTLALNAQAEAGVVTQQVLATSAEAGATTTPTVPDAGSALSGRLVNTKGQGQAGYTVELVSASGAPAATVGRTRRQRRLRRELRRRRDRAPGEAGQAAAARARCRRQGSAAEQGRGDARRRRQRADHADPAGAHRAALGGGDRHGDLRNAVALASRRRRRTTARHGRHRRDRCRRPRRRRSPTPKRPDTGADPRADTAGEYRQRARATRIGAATRQVCSNGGIPRRRSDPRDRPGQHHAVADAAADTATAKKPIQMATRAASTAARRLLPAANDRVRTALGKARSRRCDAEAACAPADIADVEGILEADEAKLSEIVGDRATASRLREMSKALLEGAAPAGDWRHRRPTIKGAAKKTPRKKT